VIAREQGRSTGQLIDARVCEGMARERTHTPRAQHRAVRDAPEREHHARACERRELAFEPRLTALLLVAGRAIPGRDALHRVHDVRAAQPLAVPEPAPLELAVQPFARRIHEERPAGTVGAVHARREPDDHQPAGAVAEARHRSVPRCGMTRAQRGEEVREPRAFRAGRDLAFEPRQRFLSDTHRARNLRGPALALKSPMHCADIRPEMRWIGPSLLVLGLVFSTGGVAIVGQADPSADQTDAKPSVLPADQSVAPQAPPNECQAPAGFRPAPVKQQVLKDAPGNKSIVLNTSGYNYVLEGEWRPEPTAKPRGVPKGVRPNDVDSLPAAPTKAQ
jgi:hypothetical protein